MQKIFRSYFMSRRFADLLKWLIVPVLLIYTVLDYTGPERIRIREDIMYGFQVKKAAELIIQQIGDDGTVWASRGMLIYAQKPGEAFFRRKYRVPTGFNWYWLRNFTVIRYITQRPECIEFVINPDQSVCALSAGHMWYQAAGQQQFRKTFTLRHYQIGDQGVFNNGLLSTKTGSVYFGEYFRNEDSADVRLYHSPDGGQKWSVASEFPPRKIRHIHSVQQDPFTGELWMTTGDEGGAYIFKSTDGFRTLKEIGFGESFFTTQLVFTHDYVYWGTDTEYLTHTGIYRWHKSFGTVEKIRNDPYVYFFGTRLGGGTLVFSTDREGHAMEKDDYVRLIIGDTAQNWTFIKTGRWMRRNGPLFQRAKMRFLRKQESVNTLYMTVFKMTGAADADLIMIPESAIINVLNP